MFSDFIGFKLSCTTVLKILSENDASNIEDRHMWLCVPLYQALIYSMSMEKDFWNLVRDDGDTNDFDWCITQMKFDGVIKGNVLNSLKKTTFRDEDTRKKWSNNKKNTILNLDSYKTEDYYWANSIYLIKLIRDNIVHANSAEIINFQKSLYLTEEKDLLIISAFSTTINLIKEICELNYKINNSKINYSAEKYSNDFFRKFYFWLKGVTVYG